MGSEQSDRHLATSLNLPAIYEAQAGLLGDMDYAAGRLNDAFPAGSH
jgi:hypothetical protein